MSGSSTGNDRFFLENGPRVVRARMGSDSMFPFVPRGSVLVVVDARDFRRGDLAVFATEKGWICHRVLDVGGGVLRTAGDWTLVEDEPRPLSAAAGRVVAVVRKGTVIDLEWPVWRLCNRLVAAALPRLKRLVPGRGGQEGGVGEGGGIGRRSP
jgi:hypothetical protein